MEVSEKGTVIGSSNEVPCDISNVEVLAKRTVVGTSNDDASDTTIRSRTVQPVRSIQSSWSSASNRPHRTHWQTFTEVMQKYGSFVGPGILISVAYMDPGNYATGISAGAGNKFSLLFFLLLSTVIAIFLQILCIRLGTVTGYDLARCCRENLPNWMNLTIWFLAECAIIATDIAEVIGSAIALNILIKIPLPAGVVITIIDVLFVLMAYRNDTASTRFVKMFEYFVAAMVFAIVICFAVELSQILANVGQVFRGFVPSKEMFDGSGLTIATSIVGSTVMIHSLFLGSGIVQPRLREYDIKNGHVNLDEVYEDGVEKDDVDFSNKKEVRQFHQFKESQYFYSEYKPSVHAVKYALTYSIVELTLTLATVALFVNAAILIVAGATLYGTPEAVDADLYTIHALLSKNLAPVVGTIFMVALLFSGQSAGIVCTIAGQIVSEGHIRWTVKPWMRRLLTRGISIVPCLAVSVSLGRNGMGIALNVSQIIISILLPPLTAPLIYFTCKKSIMRIELDERDENGEIQYKYMNNGWIVTIIAVVIWFFISTLNIYAIYQMAVTGIN